MRWLPAPVAAAALVTSLPGAAAAPVAAIEAVRPVAHTVAMGAVDPVLADASPRPPATAGRTDRFEYLAYYPDTLRLHRGDTVHFRRDGFHTVTFSPTGQPRRGWLRRDEVEGISAIASRNAPANCGHDTALPPCVLSEAAPVLNSGWDDLTVTVDLDVGTYEYYCTIHEGMEGELEVVPDADPVGSADEIETARRESVARDTATAAALLAASQTPEVAAVEDHLRWTVKAGDVTADDRVAILRYMPSTLEIAPGDEVVFTVPGGDGAPPTGRTETSTEIHTATFPHDPVVAGFGLARYVNPACDPDSEAGGTPGAPGMYPSLVAGCPPGTTAELLLQPWAWRSPTRALGDTVVSPATVHDTGLMAPNSESCRTACDPWTGARLPSQGPATTFPQPGTFSYVCLVHPEWGMAGSISVAR